MAIAPMAETMYFDRALQPTEASRYKSPKKRGANAQPKLVELPVNDLVDSQLVEIFSNLVNSGSEYRFFATARAVPQHTQFADVLKLAQQEPIDWQWLLARQERPRALGSEVLAVPVDQTKSSSQWLIEVSPNLKTSMTRLEQPIPMERIGQLLKARAAKKVNSGIAIHLPTTGSYGDEAINTMLAYRLALEPDMITELLQAGLELELFRDGLIQLLAPESIQTIEKLCGDETLAELYPGAAALLSQTAHMISQSKNEPAKKASFVVMPYPNWTDEKFVPPAFLPHLARSYIDYWQAWLTRETAQLDEYGLLSDQWETITKVEAGLRRFFGYDRTNVDAKGNPVVETKLGFWQVSLMRCALDYLVGIGAGNILGKKRWPNYTITDFRKVITQMPVEFMYNVVDVELQVTAAKQACAELGARFHYPLEPFTVSR